MCAYIWREMFIVVFSELRRMQERISMIEAKLARNMQSVKPPSSSSERSPAVTQMSTDSVTGQSGSCESSASEPRQTSGQKPTLSQSFSTGCSSSSCSQSAPKSKASEKPGASIIFSLSVEP